ncbi:MAG: recombination mediator RecR [Desulfobacterales bacterium]
MTHYPSSIVELIRNLSKLPGIGEKTAERLAMYILKIPLKEASGLSESILKVKEKVQLCTKCFGLSDSEVCKICGDSTREQSVLCLVEQPADLVALEKSGAFKGLYHVLQGVLSPMEGVGPEDIRIRELEERLSEGRIKEVVIATGTNVEGEATACYIAEILGKLPVKVTRIASGVPIGGDLKYVDQVTLRKAMETRHVF